MSGWLVAFFLWGGPFVPYPTVGAVVLLYGPWLVLFVITTSRWARRHQAQAVRPAAISMAVLAAATLATYPYWDVAKERYFEAALLSCQSQHGVAIVWEDIPAFDANLRIFRARTDTDRRLVGCVNQKAGILIDDIACRAGQSRGGANGALEITSGNAHTLQQERFFNVVRYEYPGAANVALGSVEWCPWQRAL